MTTPIQIVSNAPQLLSVAPLTPLQKTFPSRDVGNVAASPDVALPTPSSITVMGASNPLDFLTYIGTDTLQTFVPSIFVSGLTIAQQQQLALTLGLSANATSTELTNAINSLLTPSNPADDLVNILVGGAPATPATPASEMLAATTAAPAETTAPTVTPEAAPPVATTITTSAALPASEDLSSSTYALPFDTAESVLQSLLVEESSHLLSVTNQEMANYAVPGTVSQLQAGVDKPHQANLKKQLSETFYTLDPVTRVAPSHDP